MNELKNFCISTKYNACVLCIYSYLYTYMYKRKYTQKSRIEYNILYYSTVQLTPYFQVEQKGDPWGQTEEL